MAWSLGVLDALAYVAAAGDSHISGLVLVDNSIGEDPPPTPPARARGPRLPRAKAMQAFVGGMFHTRQSQAYLDALTRSCLRVPPAVARALLSYPVPRTYWRDAVYSTGKPVLYVIRQRWMGQAQNLVRKHRSAEMVLFTGAGHALFVDQPERFDAVLADFIGRKVWTGGNSQ